MCAMGWVLGDIGWRDGVVSVSRNVCVCAFDGSGWLILLLLLLCAASQGDVPEPQQLVGHTGA